MVEKLKNIKHILIINNFNIKLMNDFYILFLKIWVSLSCFFFTKQKIKFNKKINFFENIKIYNFGCSNKYQKKEIYIRDDEIARSSLYKNYVSHYNFYKKEFFNKLFNFKKINIRSEKIKLLKLDDFIKHKVDFVKIDIEGHEYQALQGMRKILKKYMPKLIIETNSFAQKKNLLKKIFNFLSQLNYEIFCNNNLEKKINFNELNKITKNEIIDIFCVNKNKKI